MRPCATALHIYFKFRIYVCMLSLYGVTVCLLQFALGKEARIKHATETCFQKWAVMERRFWIVSRSVSISPCTVPRDKNEMKSWYWRLPMLCYFTFSHPSFQLLLHFSNEKTYGTQIHHVSGTIKSVEFRGLPPGRASVWIAVFLNGCIKVPVFSCWNVATVTQGIISLQGCRWEIL